MKYWTYSIDELAREADSRYNDKLLQELVGRVLYLRDQLKIADGGWLNGPQYQYPSVRDFQDHIEVIAQDALECVRKARYAVEDLEQAVYKIRKLSEEAY